MSVTAELLVGAQAKLAPTPYDNSNRPLSGRAFAYSSSAPGIAKVDANGVVTAVAIGVATITATAEGKSASTTVRVVPQIATVVASRVVITPGAATLLPAGQSLQLAAVPADANGNPLSNAGLVWSSANPAVATVNATGLVTGVAIGTAVITATVAGLQETLTISVTQALDGSLADVRAVIGDANLVYLGDPLTSIVLDGLGNVSQLPDARGDGYGPALIGHGSARNPTYAAPEITMSEPDQSYLQSGLDARYDTALGRVLALVGSASHASEFIGGLQDDGLAHPYLLIGEGSGTIQLNAGGTTIDSGVPLSATPRLITIQDHPVLNIDAATIGSSLVGIEVAGRVMQCDWVNGIGTSASRYLELGAIGTGLKQWASVRHVAVLPSPVQAAWRAALLRRAIAVGASVYPSGLVYQIAGVGDSIMYGQGATTRATDNITALLQGWNSYDTTNVGRQGLTTAGCIGVVNQAVAQLRDTASYAKGWVVLFIGTNDADKTAAFKNIKTIAATVRAAGWKICVCTITNRADQPNANDTLNAGIRTLPGLGVVDAVADVQALPHAQVPTNGLYFADFNLHPTSLLYSEFVNDPVYGIKAAITAGGG